MSGHFATLLRDTVRTMLRDHDVYVTDWHNARDVPLRAGRFGLDEYIEHLIAFTRRARARARTWSAICQPCVAALAAAALMAEDDHPAQPAQPDADGRADRLPHQPDRGQPAGDRASRSSGSRSNLISRVPWRLRGAGRRVYPGFVQLRRVHEHEPRAPRRRVPRVLRAPRRRRGRARPEAIRDFYEEYMAVADLPAEFYLETVRAGVPGLRAAARRADVRGREVDPSAIRRTALLTVEGERDDICAVGQTLAAQDLCTRLRPYLRTHYVQPASATTASSAAGAGRSTSTRSCAT